MFWHNLKHNLKRDIMPEDCLVTVMGCNEEVKRRREDTHCSLMKSNTTFLWKLCPYMEETLRKVVLVASEVYCCHCQEILQSLEK